MPAIEFPKGLTETENLPKTKRTLVNCFNNLQGQIISRPGIASIATTGRVARGQFVWNGSLFQVQSEQLHQITDVDTGASTNIGTIAGAADVRVAIGFNTATIVVKGGNLYTLDTSNVLTDISSNSNFVPCDDVAHINGRFVYIPSSGDPAFFSDVGAAGTVQVLSFFDAEELPDKNSGVFNFKNTLYIMGTDSVELFRDTGASPNPFGRISGARLTNGLIGGLLEYNETFLFIGREKDQAPGIYALGSGVAPKISNDAIDLVLANHTEAQMADAIVSRFKWRGYDIAVFTILNTSFAFFGGNWFELTTLVDSIPGVWQGGFITQFEGTYYTADKGNIGKLAKVNNDYGAKIERIIELGFQQDNNDFFTCQSIELGVSQGFNTESNVLPTVITDPFFAELVLLVNFDGTNGGTDAVDESSQGWALGFLNNAVLSSSNVFSEDYITALTLDGTGDSVTVGGVNPEALNLSASATGEFTIEARMFSEETTGFNSIVGYDNGGVVHILRDGNGTQLSWLDTRDSAAAQRIAGIGDISPNGTWYEVAVTCNGSANGWDIFSYVNGVQVGSYTAGGDFTDVNPLNCSIGSNNIGGGSDFKGQIQAIRITLADRYGGVNYTPELGKWTP